MGAIPNCKSSCMKNERLQEKNKRPCVLGAWTFYRERLYLVETHKKTNVESMFYWFLLLKSAEMFDNLAVCVYNDLYLFVDTSL